MDDPQETEFLTQIAAGTDPMTALAAVPDDQEPMSGCFAVVLVAILIAAIAAVA
jgi:hypothetical protein